MPESRDTRRAGSGPTGNGSGPDGERSRAAQVAAAAHSQAVAQRVHPGPHEDEDEIVYGGLVTRGIAFAIDAALIDLVGIGVAAVAALIFSVLPESHELRTVAVAVGGVLFFVWGIAYFTTFWTTTGETPGSRVMRVRVVRADGSALRIRHAFLRLVGIVLAALPLFAGFLPILTSTRRRGLQDVVAGTVVDTTPRDREARA